MNGTVSYFNSKRSNVYFLLLDATKTFDEVNYCKIFSKLLNINLSPVALSLLLYMYTYQSLKVRWGTITGNKFNVKNGVKQGGVLSPILFSVYMVLIDWRRGVLDVIWVIILFGVWRLCWWSYTSSPSKKAFQIKINIYQWYASDYDVIFNGPKRQFIIFRWRECRTENSYVLVNGEQLNNISSAVHLGHSISADDGEYTISASITQFWKGFNILELILAKYILMCSVNYLNNIVVAFMVNHCGHLIVVIK